MASSRMRGEVGWDYITINFFVADMPVKRRLPKYALYRLLELQSGTLFPAIYPACGRFAVMISEHFCHGYHKLPNKVLLNK